MIIHPEETPNEHALKFPLGRIILKEDQVIEFANKEDAYSAPLAQSLFDIEGVERIFFGQDFLVVTKNAMIEWKPLQVSVISMIMDYMLTRKIMIKIPNSFLEVMEIASEDIETAEMIKTILDTEVRPAVARDGGDILFYGYKEGRVYLRMQGACQGCPSSALTLKHGVESILRRHLPDLVSVERVDF